MILKYRCLFLRLTAMLLLFPVFGEPIAFEHIWHTPSDDSEVPGNITMRDPMFPGVSTTVTFYQGIWKGDGFPGDPANQTGGTLYFRVDGGNWETEPLGFHANVDENSGSHVQFWKADVTLPANVGAQVQYYFFVTFDNRDDTYLFEGDGENNVKSLNQGDAKEEPYSFSVSPVNLSGNAEFTVDGLNADYRVLNFYIDEVQDGLFPSIDLEVTPGVPVTHVEIFTNLNNRDRAHLDWDGDGIEDGIIPPDGNLITTSDTDAYFQAYAMTDGGDGSWSLTLPVNKTGAYRVTARFKDGESANWSWIRDQGIRDLAVVVAPTIARDMIMYELHVTNANATGPTFAQRGTFEDLHDPNNDRITLTWMRDMGINWIWFQPFHPQGLEGREIDPASDTEEYYDPGSPYSIRNFWEINPYYTHDYDGDLDNAWEHPGNYAAAMAAFQAFAEAADEKGVYLMLDFPFNHTSPDVVLGQKGVELFAPEGNPDNWQPNDQIVWHAPGFFSTNGGEGAPAYSAPAQSADGRAEAPDRNDFGKWVDVVDVFFGNYSTLVTGYPDEETSRQIVRNEDDLMFYDSMGEVTINVWRYFGEVLPYWIEQSGHRGHNDPDPSWDLETWLTEDARGIDGLRKDFGQGLPPQAMEYIINRTHSVKWNFVFMSESLDGGAVTYRSSRHFAVLNENIVFPLSVANTAPAYRQIFDDRRNAYGQSLVLLNNLSHDERPYDDPWEALIRYATVSTNDGSPMIMYGQEIGAAALNETTGIGSWDYYELNFGKNIPHFKKWNSMQPQWNAWTENELGVRFLRPVYAAIGQAREFSPALRSSNRFFLNRHDDDAPRNEIFSVAKYEQAGVSPAHQDVVLAFTNLRRDEGPSDTFAIPGPLADLIGLADGRIYDVRNIAAYVGEFSQFSERRNDFLWNDNRTRQQLIDNGVFVDLNPVPGHNKFWTGEELVPGDTVIAPYEAQFLKVYDVTSPAAAAAVSLSTGLTYNATPELVMSVDTSSFDEHDNVVEYAIVINDENSSWSYSTTVTGTEVFSWEVDPDAFGREVTVTVTPVSIAGVAGTVSTTSGAFTVLDPDGDEDGNGMTNFQEFIAGTDPFVASSALRAENIALSGANPQVSFTGMAGRRYRLEYSEDFLTGVAEPTWIPVINGGWVQASTDNQVIELEDPEEDPPSRIYRIVVQRIDI